ncbi:MAG: translation initiation factor IF-2 [Bacteroidota bacterium]|nr:translation initiation factor IF-2 [Bacteroidota bacterium]
MSEERFERLRKVASELNIALGRAVDFLNSKGYSLRLDPNTKINEEQYKLLIKEFAPDLADKKEASNLSLGKKSTENFVIETPKSVQPSQEEEDVYIKSNNSESDFKRKEIVQEEYVDKSRVILDGPKVLGKIDLSPKKSESVKAPSVPATPPPPSIIEVKQEIVPEIINQTPVAEPEIESIPADLPEEIKTQLIEAKADSLKGLTVLGKINLPVERPAKKEDHSQSNSQSEADKKKRKRIKVEGKGNNVYKPVGKDFNQGRKDNKPGGGNRSDKPAEKGEITDKHIQDKIKETLSLLSGGKANVSRAKYRKVKRSAAAEAEEERQMLEHEDSKILKVTEFISANDLAQMMNVNVNEIISACLTLGMFVSINQRLDAETISIIAEEFGYTTQFTTAEEEITVMEDADDPKKMIDRAPIVTIMGHVDHGKTSLLDFIRKTNVTSREAGGITQHIGAYDVKTANDRWITFLDTPGHEAFTAMRARGAKVTDVAIIVVAADDGVMPQTKEALNHALVAGVPIIIAINKIDKPSANPDRIKEQLAKENILVEDWGGKYQVQGVSAKTGAGIPELLEKVLLESDLMELKATADKRAVGTVIEAELDKGRGYVTTLLVQSGTLRVGDIILAGQFYGRVRAMLDHKGTRLETAGPSKPVQILGLPGAPQAGDKFNVMTNESEAREIANKREQILREQSIRTKKHITLDEIGRRLAIGNFKQLNIIIKGDFDGSVEAISDSMLKLSTPEVQVMIIHKGVGQISESDVLLASASDAVIIAFNVRPSLGAKKLAENEQIEIRSYSIIYNAINDIKDAMEGMLEPTMEEHIMGTAEVRETFKITKVGTIAGCIVIDGNIKRSGEVRLIRDGIVIHTGKFASMKRFKDDANEVKLGQDCGLGIANYNDIEVGDLIEVFDRKEVKRTL